MTNFRSTLAFLATLATVWGATYMHDRAHRYDIVAAAAGSGGTQGAAGEMAFHAFVIDHQTGKVWESEADMMFVGMPLIRVTCTAERIKKIAEVMGSGCNDSAAQETH